MRRNLRGVRRLMMAHEGNPRERTKELIMDALTSDSVIGLEFTRGIYIRHEGSLSKERLFGGKFCSSARLIDICASSRTDENGRTTIALRDFVCLAEPAAGANFERLSPPVFFVATPRTDTAVHVTHQVRVIDSEPTIEVFSWDAGGNATRRVPFDWHCCVQVFEIVG
jgi:hypothetical protein